MKRKLLITGAAGTIGNVIYNRSLKDNRYEVVGADIQADEKLGIVQMDIGDEARLTELTQGIDTVLHLPGSGQGDFLGKVLGEM